MYVVQMYKCQSRFTLKQSTLYEQIPSKGRGTVQREQLNSVWGTISI